MEKQDSKKKVAVIGSNLFDTLGFHFNLTFNNIGYNSKIFDIYDHYSLEGLTNYTTRFSINFENLIFKRLANKIINFKPDLVLCLYRNVPPFVIDLIKKEFRIKVVFLTGDHLGNFERGYPFISDFDAFFVKDKYIVRILKDKLNLNAYYLPESFNPQIHTHYLNEYDFGANYDISLVGNLYPYRAKILDQIINDYNISLFGITPKWMDLKWGKLYKGDLRGQQKSEIFFKSKINLNTLRYEEIYGANCRVFEIAGSGGFQICDRKKDIKELFEEDKEIVMFDTIDELREKFDYYLKHQDKAYEIGCNARKRALAQHTYKHRIKQILEITNLTL
jgi:spore maturation protein CgeB